MRDLRPPFVSSAIATHLADHGVEKVRSFKDIAGNPPLRLNGFEHLRTEIARLSVANPNSILFYRGQNKDYLRDGVSTIMPSIYRNGAELIDDRNLKLRWRDLKIKSRLLCEEVEKRKIENYSIIKSRKLIQWSILQHYEAAMTPLTDVTQSIRVAASFATLNNDSDSAVIYVFALPYYHNRISRNSEEVLTNIRLLSLCPSEAKRPYYQEGFLIGEEDIEFGGKVLESYDLRRRMIAKFEIPNTPEMWGADETPLTYERLYPEGDVFTDICRTIKDQAAEELRLSDVPYTEEEIFEAMIWWRKIENLLTEKVGHDGRTPLSEILKALDNPRLSRRIGLAHRSIMALMHPRLAAPAHSQAYLLDMRGTYQQLKQNLNR